MCLPTSNNSVNDHEDASVSGHEDSLVNAQVSDVRRESAGLQRKILGSWKQYSGRKFPEFFPVDSDNFQCFPRGSFRNYWKKSGKFRTRILLLCSRYFPCFPAGSGGRNDRPG